MTKTDHSMTPTSSSSDDLPAVSILQCHYPNCKKPYTGKDARVNLRRHIRTVHEKSKTIKCPNCGYKSTRRDNVRKHFSGQHLGAEMPPVLMCKTTTWEMFCISRRYWLWKGYRFFLFLFRRIGLCGVMLDGGRRENYTGCYYMSTYHAGWIR